LNPSPELDRLLYKENILVDNDILHTYLSLCEIEGKCKDWLLSIQRFLVTFLDSVKWTIDKKTTIDYLKIITDKKGISYCRKHIYQIRKFLTYLKIEWANDIRPPSEPTYLPKRITEKDIKDTLSYFKDNAYYIQIKALVFLGISSGMRAEELYQLTIEDIRLDNRVVHINHNPKNGQSTKTKISRISFFNENAKQEYIEYFKYFNNDNKLKCLFNQSHISRLFRNAPIQVKDLRKYFSQEWDRRSGPTSIKKILMGHSLKGDVDLMHYNYQSEEDLKKIYDKVMGEGLGLEK
jgi:integrase/recombinase XerD